MYYVLYVEKCTPKMEKIPSKKEVKIFLDNFLKKYGSLDDGSDNWIDHIFSGKKLEIEVLFNVK